MKNFTTAFLALPFNGNFNMKDIEEISKRLSLEITNGIYRIGCPTKSTMDEISPKEVCTLMFGQLGEKSCNCIINEHSGFPSVSVNEKILNVLEKPGATVHDIYRLSEVPDETILSGLAILSQEQQLSPGNTVGLAFDPVHTNKFLRFCLKKGSKKIPIVKEWQMVLLNKDGYEIINLAA